MGKIKINVRDFNGQPTHKILDDVLDYLLENGNELARNPRWGSNPTGYFSLLKKPIDFELVKRNFEFPDTVILDEKYGEIDYGLGTVTIKYIRE